MTVTLALIVVIAAVLVPLIHRDLTRATRRRTVTMWITADVSQYVATMRAFARAAADFQAEMRKTQRVLDRAGRVTREQLADLEMKLRPEANEPGSKKTVI